MSDSVDPDETAHYDLGLHCFPVSLYGTLGLDGLKSR